MSTEEERAVWRARSNKRYHEKKAEVLAARLANTTHRCGICGKPVIKNPNSAETVVCHPCRRTEAWQQIQDRTKRLREVLANRTRAAQLRAAWVEEVDPLVVFERDKWICQLCGGLTNRERDITTGVVWYDPLLATVDHIIALTKGGKHSYANTQTAHHRCNASKGNR